VFDPSIASYSSNLEELSGFFLVVKKIDDHIIIIKDWEKKRSKLASQATH